MKFQVTRVISGSFNEILMKFGGPRKRFLEDVTADLLTFEDRRFWWNFNGFVEIFGERSEKVDSAGEYKAQLSGPVFIRIQWNSGDFQKSQET